MPILITLILANHLLVVYFVLTDGPLDMFAKIRQVMGVTTVTTIDDDGDMEETESADGSFTSGVFSCTTCMSIYTATALSIIALATGHVELYDLPLTILAVAGGTVLIT